MSRISTALTLAAFLVASAPAVAQRSPPTSIQFFYLKATTPGENSSLSGECDGTTASPEVTCNFTQLSVRYRLDPKNLSAELEKRVKQMRTEAGKNPKEYASKICAELPRARAKLEQLLKASANQSVKASIQDFISLCASPSMDALETWIRRATTAESKACRVSVFRNDPVTFKKVAENRWVANVGPQGLCNSVYLYTMESEPKSPSLWKWSQVRTYADRSTELCKDTELNVKLEFNWLGEEPDLACETISFGM